jgi:hypothetical protein
MRRLLQETFDVVAPALDEALVAPDVRQQTRAGLVALAPILQLGLEVRLEAGATQVDVQQAVLREQGHHHVLARHIGQVIEKGGTALDPAWHRIGALARPWAAGTDFDWLHEVWLEYDVTQPLTAATLPSVFVNAPVDRPLAESRAAIERTTALLWGRPLPPALQSRLQTCFEEVPDGAWVSHVGMMLARSVDALRVNVKGLAADAVDGFLHRVGGRENGVGAHVAWLLEHAHHVTVCLDVGVQVGPKVGLEAFFQEQPERDAGWALVLDGLVERGACTPAKCEALLAWSGISVPPRVAAPWPGELMARALLEPDRLSVLARRLNHVKVTCRPGHPLEAKAYLGIGHLWVGEGSTAPESEA